MKETSNYAVIMAGGKGERFWPLSTERRPKQLLDLVGGKPMIQLAVERLEGLIPPERVLIVTHESLVEPIRNVLGEGSPVALLGEPVGRDTAAAIAAGAAWIRQRDPEAVFCVLTADHVIGDRSLFLDTLRQGLALCAEHDVLMTIGISPVEPSSAYGYIEAGEVWNPSGSGDFFHVRRFVEKPNPETARAYLETGRYVWNSGMFVWSVRSIQRAFADFRPDLAARLESWSACADEAEFRDAMARDYPGLSKISIDYAIMEKAQNIVVCKGRFAWDDVGSWPALSAHLSRDGQGNAVRGDVTVLDSAGNVVVSDGRLTALVGVRDLVVVQAEGVTLVCDRNRSQDIKALLAELRSQNRVDLL